MISQVDGGRPAAARPGRAIRPVAGVLPDGTAFFAPVGEVILDGPKVVCHLCGRSLRSVAAHLAAHGWTKEKYCKAFGLERSQPLEGPETRKLRAAALTARLIFDPAIRAGSAAGRQRARSGDLARDAAAAARGRPFPEQRRRKAARSAGTFPAEIARARRERADGYLAAVAADARYALAYFDLGNVLDETERIQDAVVAYRTAIQLAPTYADAHYNLALAYERLGQARRALLHWKTYLKLDSSGPWAVHARNQVARILETDPLKIVYKQQK